MHVIARGLLPERPASDAKKHGDGKSVKLSRTGKWRLEREAELQAQEALRRAALPPGQQPVMETLIKFGRVEKYDGRTMSGVISIMEPIGRIELPFSASAIIRAGITTLAPGQKLECIINKRPDGAMMVAEIKLSVGERAPRLNEMARQAEAAETNYKLFGRRTWE
jgi:hypothetical protein